MKRGRLLICFSFFLAWVSLGHYLSLNESPTFDEPIHFKAGQLYEQGIYDFDPIEPPLIRRLAVWLFPAYPRLTVIISTGLLASALILVVSRSLAQAFLVAVFLLLEPNLISHSHYLTTDAIAAFSAVLTGYLIFKEFWQKRSQILLLGLLIGLSAAIKVASLSLLLPLLLIKLPRLTPKKALILALISLTLVWATYNFGFHSPLGRINLPLPLGGYLRAIKENLQFAQRGQPLYFAGQLYFKGPIYKDIAVFLLKTPLPLLLLGLWGFASRRAWPFLLIATIGLVVNTLTPLSFGSRHLLPVNLAFVLAAVQIGPATFRRQLLYLALVLLLFVETWRVLPHPITYANLDQIIPAHRILTDSDLDWGQGLISLKKELNWLGISQFQLAYSGNVDPQKYLGPYQRIKDCNPVDSKPIVNLRLKLPQIISVTCYYQANYHQNRVINQKPHRLIARSFLLFHD